MIVQSIVAIVAETYILCSRHLAEECPQMPTVGSGYKDYELD